ncbi:MAG: VWA domain-containing protein [Acidobacteria bacterium]|nr:VWA domain-containing protein [Acidobacteriota bacterium]
MTSCRRLVRTAAIASAAGLAAITWLRAQSQPAFRSSANLVEVDVIVTSRDGRFIPDLTARDFELREEGVRQEIRVLSLITGAGAGGPPAPDTSAAAGRTAPRIFVFVLDHQNLAPAPLDRARKGLRRFVEREMKPGDLAGVVSEARGTARLTASRDEVLGEIDSLKPRSDTASRRLDFVEWPRILNEMEALQIDQGDRALLEAVVGRACESNVAEVSSQQCREVAQAELQRKSRQFVIQTRAAAERTVQLLTAVSNHLAQLDGRKTLVLFSEGIIAPEYSARFREIGRMAARARVAIYPIDTRGLDRTDASRSLQATAPSDSGLSLDYFDTSDDPPALIADATGGRVVRNTNNVADALAGIAQETSAYYIVGYAPANTDFDGKYRSVSVRVQRPGLTVRARRGYFATPPAARPATLSAAGGIAATPGPVPALDAPILGAPAFAVYPVSAESLPDALAVGPSITERKVRDLMDRGDPAPGDRDGFRLAPHGANEAASRGWTQYQRGDVAGARDFLAEASADPGAPPWVPYALGQSEFALQHFDKAAASWQRVRTLAPAFRPVYFDLADAFLQLRAYGEAVAVLRDAARVWPNDPEILNALGVVQVRRGALDDAIESFDRAIAAAPDDGDGWFNRGRAMEMRYQRSRRYIEAMAQWVGSDGDRRKAIESYERYLAIGGAFETAVRESLQRLRWTR